MSTYQDVVLANQALAAWALTEPSGTTFVPYIGGSNLIGTNTFDYQQTGPFAASFGLRGHVGAKLALAFVTVVNPPVTRECWFRLPSATPTNLQILFYTGNAGANGSGVYVATNGHIHVLHAGVTDVDTLLLWPDTNWHLIQLAANANGVTETLAIDGAVRWRATPATANAPAPNTLFFMADSSTTTNNLITVAMPAFYPTELSSQQLAASFLASTNPDAAMGVTLSGGGDLLAAILACVRKTF
jgi:hypothetical protein